jgi:hypothetical protein
MVVLGVRGGRALRLLGRATVYVAVILPAVAVAVARTAPIRQDRKPPRQGDKASQRGRPAMPPLSSSPGSVSGSCLAGAFRGSRSHFPWQHPPMRLQRGPRTLRPGADRP